MALTDLGGLWTIVTIGLALGMDAFSLGLGLGAQGLRWRDVARLSVLISAFHVVLPLLGIYVGDFLHALFGHVFERIGAVVMLALGAKMAIEAWGPMEGRAPSASAGFLQLLAFAFGVSVDALSVGFGLGTLHVDPLEASVMFGALSGILSVMGLYLGRKASQALGSYGRVAGGAVLVLLGLKIFF